MFSSIKYNLKKWEIRVHNEYIFPPHTGEDPNVKKTFFDQDFLQKVPSIDFKLIVKLPEDAQIRVSEYSAFARAQHSDMRNHRLEVVMNVIIMEIKVTLKVASRGNSVLLDKGPEMGKFPTLGFQNLLLNTQMWEQNAS